jgi:nitrate/nitrite-specific signal transduction histidine kinase
MRERAQRIDATLEIGNVSGAGGPAGTVVQVSVASQSLLTHEGLTTP